MLDRESLESDPFLGVDATLASGDGQLLGSGVDSLDRRQQGSPAAVRGGDHDAETVGVEFRRGRRRLRGDEPHDLEPEVRIVGADGGEAGVAEGGFAGEVPGFLGDVSGTWG